MIHRSRSNDLPAPPGFNPAVGQNHMEVTMDTDQSHLILKKSWDIALGPIKQVSNSIRPEKKQDLINFDFL